MGFFLSRVEKEKRKKASLAAAGMGLSGPTLEVQCVLLVSYYDKIFKIIHEVGVFLGEGEGRGENTEPRQTGRLFQ